MLISLDDRRKFKSAEKIPSWFEKNFHGETFHHTLLEIHGVNLLWRCSYRPTLQEMQDHFPVGLFVPKIVNPEIEICWCSPKEVGETHRIWNDADPNCRFMEKNGFTYVIQRDFIVAHKGSQIYLMCDFELEDGFNNFLRWLLPSLLILKQKALLHSSTVLNERTGRAYICLGESGAGKSTIAGQARPDLVLGDDMTIIKKTSAGWLVEPALVGQSIQSQRLCGKAFPIEGFFVLEKSQRNHLTQISSTSAFPKLAGSFANLFWDRMGESQASQVQDLIRSLLLNEKFYRLEFDLSGKVWEHLYEKNL